VVAVSMSGRAPGPLGLAAEAARRGCRLLTVGQPRSPLAEVSERTGGVHVGVPPGDTKAARAEASMGGGEKATAAVPSPASSRQRITRFKPYVSPSIAIPPPLVLHKPYLEK
jgi:hypothetical protein